MKISLPLLVGLVGALSSATGAPILYNIDFVGGTPNPTSGSFSYDANGPGGAFFSDFIIIWNGFTLDATNVANNPPANHLENLCRTASPDPVDIFKALTGACPGTILGWQAIRGTLNSQIRIGDFGRTLSSPAVGYVSTAVTAPEIPAGQVLFSSGTYSIVAVPEPSTVWLTVAAGGLLLVKRRKPGKRLTE